MIQAVTGRVRNRTYRMDLRHSQDASAEWIGAHRAGLVSGDTSGGDVDGLTSTLTPSVEVDGDVFATLTSTAGCTQTFGGCASATLGRAVPPRTCVQ